MPKVLFVATVVKTHIMEFHIPYLQMFKDAGWETAVASRNDYENKADCVIPYCDTYYDVPFARNPLHSSNIKAYQNLKSVIEKGNYDIIHCHTPVGGVLSRLAVRNIKGTKPKVIYTAHGFHFYKGAPLLNWLIYYPIERWMARYTDVLITINKEDYERAKSFHAKKVCFVSGVGINLEKFAPSKSPEYTEVFITRKREELSLAKDDFVILSVGELIKRKNHEVVIKAAARIRDSSPEVYEHLQYVICGRGILEDELKQLACDLGIEDHVHFLGYRNDIRDICHISDLFVFMSLQEGLPVALMEAIAMGLPVVCSPIRGNQDLVINGENGVFSENTDTDVAKSICAFHKKEIVLKDNKEMRHKKMLKYDIAAVKEQMQKIYFGEE